MKRSTATDRPAKPSVAVVVGGTKGMGRAASLALARDGFAVFAGSRGQKDVDALCDEGREAGLRIDGMACDAEDELALDAFIDTAVLRHGGIDALIFAAGRAYSGNALDLSSEDWDSCFRINLRAPFLAAKRALPVMMSGGGGSIVFVSTIWAFTTPRDRLAYLTAKSGLTALVRGLAVDHGGQGIRVNAVAPGYVDTEFLRQSIETVHGSAKTPEVLANVLKAHPMGRMVQPTEVAEAISFLAGERSSGFNGQTLVVDGGATTKFSLADTWCRSE